GIIGRGREGVAQALDARADATNVQAANLRIAEEEAVGEPDRIDPWRAGFEAVDVAALGLDREDEVAEHVPVVRGLQASPETADVTAKAGKVHAEREAGAPARPDPV